MLAFPILDSAVDPEGVRGLVMLPVPATEFCTASRSLDGMGYQNSIM